MPSRREIREAAFILSFEMLFRDDSVEELCQIVEDEQLFTVTNEIADLVKGIQCKAEELDGIISNYSNKRSIERIPKINLAILRLAIYESMYDDKVPINVAISEAVALAEKFAQEPDIAFINGILGAYSRSGQVSNE